jgi:CO/xanthine dehydrogenase Mo-binding subunit
MNAPGEFSRRQFIKVSALAGGGMMLGTSLGWPRYASAATTAFAPNAWITITPNGVVTFTCHRNEMGQDVHTSLTMLLAEELAVDPRLVKVEQAAVNAVYLNKMLGGQITGGSTSVRDAWEPLRQAGATARVMLVNAAAAKWKVAAADCRAENGYVIHGSKKLAYGALADAAAHLPVPASVPMKPPGEYKIIGKPLARLDGADKARGRTVFGIDAKQPGMLYAALAPSPVLGGKVAKFDDSVARKRPGVRKVVSIGDGVAVIADHYWVAHSALADLKIEWDAGARATIDNAAIYNVLEQAKDKPGTPIKQAGNAADVLAKGKPIEARYTCQMLAHMALEPQNCLALVSAKGVDVWVSTQFPQGAQGVAAKAASVAPEMVRIHPQFVGGGFGRRIDVDAIALGVAVAKTMPGTPIKLIWTREDDTTHDVYRPPSLHLLRAALDNGRVTAFTHKLISPSITNRLFPGAVQDGKDGFMTEGLVDFTYNIPNLDLRTVIQEVGIDVGYWRSVSNALNAFAIEGFVDELAHAAGQDPVAFRLAMLDTLPRQHAVLARAAKEANFVAKPSNGHAFGVASMVCYDTHMAMIAEVSGTADKVKLEKLTIVADCGVAVHPDQVVAQLEGGAVTGLINTLRSKVTIKNGVVEQRNFDTFPIPRMSEVPPITVTLISGSDKLGGVGEAGVPLVAPAIANAVFALTGKRIRALPLEDQGVKFV